MAGSDITSYDYPFVSKYQEQPQGAVVSSEGHEEPNGDAVMSMVKDAEHPLFSSTGLKNLINKNRGLGNSPSETLIEGDIPDQVIGDMLTVARELKFPFEILAYAVDYAQKLDERSSASDASGLATKLRSFATQLIGTLGRHPTNAEVLMASVLESTGSVKTIVEKAQTAPDEIAQPIGSKYDDIIFNKQKFGEKTPRTNKEVYQYFKKRMVTGNDVFPWFPLGESIYDSSN